MATRPTPHWSRTYLADGATLDAQAHAQTVSRHVFDRLDQGWTPEQGDLPPITLST